MTSSPRPAPIAEVHGIDRARFDADVRASAQPVILRGLADDWPAVRAARRSDEALVTYLKTFSHAEPVGAIVGAPEIDGRFFYEPDLTALNFTRGRSQLDPFLDRLLRDRTAARPYAMAVQSIPAPDLLPGFVAEHPMALLDDSVVPRLWLGNAIRVATHYDLMENIAVVVAGRRRFTLFPPDQVANLYMGPYELTPAGTPVSMVDPDAPDLDRYPRFAEALAHASEATLEPGDALYIPFHWWHAVASLSPVNVLCNYWWNPAPQGLPNPYDALLLGLYALRTLPDDQRRAWQAMFDHLVFQSHGDPSEHLPPQVRGVLGQADRTGLERMRTTLLQSLGRA
ncbi:cupin-like domain-containing protein [Sphingomonas sp. GC_Shp_3]|uniref:cupin-like domain-containing protein n=1 Tax=Sphingomonas sp. GC_Shp_3 TaxID=2937383 RepID=UPI00226AAE7D|nr:cupin-like domain-containing protein [Sphingomonas sp. GC_Shp_3]